MNRLAEILRELKNHVGETYNTLDKGSTGKNIRHDANALAKTLKSAFPMLEKDPQYVSAEDLINSGFGVMPLSTKLPETAFSKAHALAQKNAALPIEQGGLGLHPDNTAMDRARALGFDVDTTVYHGTNGNINEFTKKNIYSTDDPKIAELYTSNKSTNISEPNIYPLYSKSKNQLEISDFKKGTTDAGYYPDNIRELFGSNKKDGKILEQVKSKGFDRLKINDVIDLGGGGQTQYITFDPKNIRSRFAAFDPMQKNSANILASLLLGIGLAKDEK